MTRVALLLAVLAVAGCGSSSGQPKGDASAFAVRVLDQIVHNQYRSAWGDLHLSDQAVAPISEYVQCERRSPVITRPRSVQVVSVHDESIGIGDGTFVPSKAVGLKLGFGGGFSVVHTVHVVAEHGKWKWILPPARYRDYKENHCPIDVGSPPPPASA